MSAFEFAFAAGYGVAIFDAIFKDANVCLAAFARAGNNEVIFGYKTEAGHFGASVTICFGNGINYFLHFGHLRVFFLPFGREQTAQRELKSG